MHDGGHVLPPRFVVSIDGVVPVNADAAPASFAGMTGLRISSFHLLRIGWAWRTVYMMIDVSLCLSQLLYLRGVIRLSVGIYRMSVTVSDSNENKWVSQADILY